MRLGTEFKGSKEIETSVAEEEILPQKTSFFKFSLMNKADCTVSINESEPIFLEAGMGFNTDQVDVKITSFKIMESGVEFYWVGGC